MNAQSYAHRDRTYAEVLGDLERACVPTQELHGPGHVALSLAAGRIVALAFSKDGSNLFWSNPALRDTARVTAVGELAGGIGGDRLWFAPELRYHWKGEPDWAGLGNYQVPAATDPGQYTYVDLGIGTIAVTALVSLPTEAGQGPLTFSIRRAIRFTSSPLAAGDPLMRGVQFVGIEITHHLAIGADSRAGEVDLWHLLQVPAGSVIIVPVKAGHERALLSYALPGAWRSNPDSVTWRINGDANAKIGFAAAALTGRAAVLRKLQSGQWCLIVRQFPADPSEYYADHPYGVPRNDQVVQVWDGGGFGELEYHSPALVVEQGARALVDQDQIWAFGAPAPAIASIADRLLGMDIRPMLSVEGRDI